MGLLLFLRPNDMQNIHSCNSPYPTEGWIVRSLDSPGLTKFNLVRVSAFTKKPTAYLDHAVVKNKVVFPKVQCNPVNL